MSIVALIEKLRLKIKTLTNNNNEIEEKQILNRSQAVVSTIDEIKEDINTEDKFVLACKMLKEIENDLDKIKPSKKI